ncbi:MAG: response regulator transcription factor [bacterium]|nr:response regulator transcription factor [bacterium]
MNENLKILLLEDDPNLGLIIQESLEHLGYHVTLLTDGEAGLAEFRNESFDLCLVDVMMPLRDGFSFAREVRNNNSDIPLIFLTAKSLTEDKVAGFKIGCDDYITKPFSMEELVLRIQAVLSRRGISLDQPVADEFEIGRFSFEFPKQVLRSDDQEVQLTAKEAELLRLLCLHQNQTLERSAALLKIWGDDSYHAGRSMDVFISRLRKILKEDPRIEIKTIHGQGYRLLVD